MGKIKKIINGTVVEVDDTIDENQMVKTIENGVVVEKPLKDVKKKDVAGSDALLAGEAGGGAAALGSIAGSAKSSQLQSPSQLESGNRDIFEGMQETAANPRPVYPQKPLTLIDDEKAKKLIVKRDGNTFKISPDKIPDGYEKTIDGAKQYVSDLEARNYNAYLAKDQESFDQTNSELERVATISGLSGNKYTVSKGDLNDINELLGTSFEGADENTLQALKDKKKQLQSKFSQLNLDEIVDVLSVSKEISKIDRYIQKVGNHLTKQQPGSDKEVPILGADTRSDWNRWTTRSINENLKALAQRMGVENESTELVTGIESKKLSNPKEYDMLMSRLKDGKAFSSVKAHELILDGANIIKARNLEFLEDGQMSMNEYRKEEKMINDKVDNSFLGKPDILQYNIADIISKYYQEGHDKFVGHWSYSDKEIDAVPKSVFEEAGINPDDPKVKQALQNIKDNESWIPFDNAIPKDGYVREFARSLWSPISGTAATLGGIGTSSDQKRIDKELEPISEFENTRTKYFNEKYGGIADAFSGFGQFIGQYALMELTGGLIKTAGIGAGGTNARMLIKSPEAGGFVSLRGGTKFGNYVMDKSTLWGRVATPFLSTFDSYYKEALTNTDNRLAANVAAFANASMEALSEQLFNDVAFGRQVIKNFRGGQLNATKIAKIFDKGVNPESISEFKNVFRENVVSAMKSAAKSGFSLTQEAAEEVPVALTNFVVDAILNPASVNGRDAIEEMGDSFKAGLVSFSIPSLIGFGGSLKKTFSNSATQSDALMIAAKNRPAVVDALNILKEDGDISQDELNYKMKVLNEATVALRDLPSVNSLGDKLSEKERVDYMSLTVQEKMLKSQNESLDKDDPIVKANNKKISELNKQKEDIIIKEQKEDDGNKVESAVITINGKEYEGVNHAEAILKAQQDGQDISKVDRQAEGMFRLTDGTVISREEANKRFGQDRSELLIPQNEESKKANEEYKAYQDTIVPESDRILNDAAEVEKNISPVMQKVTAGESVNENDLNDASNKLYDLLDTVDKSNMTEEEKGSISNLIEPLIIKLESHENITKTETRQVTEAVPTENTTKVKRSTKPVLEQSTNQPVSVQTKDGKRVDGVLREENGTYVLYNENGEKNAVIGEKAVTDINMRLPNPEVMDNPIEMDEYGRVKSVTFETKDGKLVTIKNPDLALDLAIQLQADQLGEIPDGAFQKVYEEVQKEVKEEVPVEKKLSQEDQALLDDVRSKSGQMTALEGLPFFVEQTANDPAKAIKQYGEEAANKLLSKASDTQLTRAAVNLAKFDVEHPGIDILNKEIERRESYQPKETKQSDTEGSQQQKPSESKQLEEIKNGDTVTFSYKSEKDIPDLFKDKISSKGENNGEPFIRVTMAKSLADYELNRLKNQQQKPSTEEVKPDKPKENKTENKTGRYEQAARRIADRINKAKLPDWLKINDDNLNTKGASFDDIKKALAAATIEMGKLMDKGVAFYEAVKQAVQPMVDLLGESNRDKIEAGFIEEYKKQQQKEMEIEAKDAASKIKDGKALYEDVIDGRDEDFIEEVKKNLFKNTGPRMDTQGFQETVQRFYDQGITKEDLIKNLESRKKITKKEQQIIDSIYSKPSGIQEDLKEIFGAIAKGQRPKRVMKRLAVSDVADLVKGMADFISYNPVTNKQLEDMADYIMEAMDMDSAVEYLNAMSNSNLADVKQLLRAKMIVALQEKGDTATAKKLVADMADEANMSGRQIQSLRRAYEILNASGSPEVKTEFARKYIEKVQKRAKAMNAKLMEELEGKQKNIDELNKKIHEKVQKSSKINKLKNIIDKLCNLRSKK